MRRQACSGALILLQLLPAQAAGQPRVTDSNAHAWLNFFGDHPIGESRWELHVEAQARRSDLVKGWQQLLLRPGVNYSVNQSLVLTGGYAFVRSHRYGDYPANARTTPEHRIWEQALLRYKTGKLAWSTRLRFENRFPGVRDGVTGQLTGYRLENRFRAWERVSIPLSKNYFIAAYDEIFFYAKPYRSASVLDQNRAYAALGRRFGREWDVELGYLNQRVWQRNGNTVESNHTLMFSVFSRKRL